MSRDQGFRRLNNVLTSTTTRTQAKRKSKPSRKASKRRKAKMTNVSDIKPQIDRVVSNPEPEPEPEPET